MIALEQPVSVEAPAATAAPHSGGRFAVHGASAKRLLHATGFDHNPGL